MKKPYQETNLLEFQKKYQTEQDCEKRLFELRWPQGFVCPIRTYNIVGKNSHKHQRELIKGKKAHEVLIWTRHAR